MSVFCSLKKVIKPFILSDLNDFDNTTIAVFFEPDEIVNDDERATPIRIFDDTINEAHEQVFVVQLRLISSINPVSVTFTRQPASLCRIIDDDSKYNNEVCATSINLFVIMQLLELDLSYHATHTWNLTLTWSSIQHLYPQQI